MPERNERTRRHRAIREIVRSRTVASQDDLVEALAEVGVHVAQSTLSRDLRELRITRVPMEDGYRYVDPDAAAGLGSALAPADRERLRNLAPLEVVDIACNETAIVIRTLTGRAQGVGVFIDRAGIEDVLGTIAGDDAVLVLPRSTRKTKSLRDRLAALFDVP